MAVIDSAAEHNHNYRYGDGANKPANGVAIWVMVGLGQQSCQLTPNITGRGPTDVHMEIDRTSAFRCM